MATVDGPDRPTRNGWAPTRSRWFSWTALAVVSSSLLQLAVGHAQTGNATTAEVWSTVTLTCPLAANGGNVTWLSPSGLALTSAGPVGSLPCPPARPEPDVSDAPLDVEERRLRVAANHTLTISDFAWTDRGRYTCWTTPTDSDDELESDRNVTVATVEVRLDPAYRRHIYYISLIVGGATALGLLLLALLFKLVYYLLNT
jgi:hypothetical protein